MMSAFFQSQQDYIFFIYGASFLLLIPISLFLRARINNKMAWTWLAWFGVIHGLNEWLDLLDLSLGLDPEFDIARLILLGISFVFLAEFGRASIAGMGSRVPGRWILAVMVGLAGLGGLAGMAGLFACTRYVLGFGGVCWAAGALILAGRNVRLGSGQFKAAASFMSFYGLASGLVPNPAPFFPANWLNSNSFLTVTGFPIQLGRGVLGVGIAISLCLLAQAYLKGDQNRRFGFWFRHLLLGTLTGLAAIWVGGWFLTQYFGTGVEREMRTNFAHSVKVLHQLIIEDMAEADHLVQSMTEAPEFSLVSTTNPLNNTDVVNSLLDRCSQTLKESICFVMDPQGLTIASSNRNALDSFVGKSYAFRPYFQQAMQGSLGRYWALGVTSKEIGYYASSPVRDQAGNVIGVAVVTRPFNKLREVLPDRSTGLIINPHGIVILANHPDLVLRSLFPLAWETQEQLVDSRQLGNGPFAPILDRQPLDGDECLFEGKRLRVLLQPGFWQDWSMVCLEPMTPIIQGRLLGIGATVIISMLLLGFLTISSIMRQSEEGFRQLFDNGVDILILHDMGRIVAVNQQALTSLGYSKEELLGMSLFDIEVGIGIDDLFNLWQQGCELYTQAGVFRRKNGSTFPVEVRSANITYRGQNLRLAAVRDITERKRAEEVLLESEKRFRDVAENAQEWVWEFDAEGKYTYSSPIVEKLLGYKPEEIIGKYFYDLFIPEDREKLLMIAFWAFAGKQPLRQFVSRSLHKDGSIVCLSSSGVPILDKTGNLLGYRGADTDITERQKAEEALRQSEEGFRQLFENAVDILVLHDMGRIVAVNQQACTSVGYTRDEFLRMSLFDIEVGISREDLIKLWEKGGGLTMLEGVWRRRDGSTFPAEIRAAVISYRGQNLRLAAVRDITERKRAEEALRLSQQGYQHLASKLMTVQEAERQRLARELHDDLTQRLAVLAMDTGDLERQMSNLPPSTASPKLTGIREQLVQLSMDVHAISRRLHPSILDDLGLADAIASECASFGQHYRMKVNFEAKDIPQEVPKETAINIYRIAQEALRNISKHARATTVDVALLGGNETIHLTIRDNGQGIDPRERKMQGLGLVSMKERTSLIGGDLSIQSYPGNGTLIEVTAPLAGRAA